MPQYPPDTQMAKATETLVKEPSARLDELNSNIKAASASSERLARALNLLTGIGAIVALAGVGAAIIEMVHHWTASGG